jgi:hypothetical protein
MSGKENAELYNVTTETRTRQNYSSPSSALLLLLLDSTSATQLYVMLAIMLLALLHERVLGANDLPIKPM